VEQQPAARTEETAMTFVLFVLPVLIIALAVAGFLATRRRDEFDEEVRT
jgi:Na+-transporting methylmalonyl-CoA/oxaloacetate decarboxylase gamma subunit